MGAHLERSLPPPVSFEIDIYGPTFGLGTLRFVRDLSAQGHRCPRFNCSKAPLQLKIRDLTAARH
jgi:hypothetical protein